MNKNIKILIVNGPNLNLLGKREPEIYGHLTLDEINAKIEEYARGKNIEVEFFQSNSEGALIDALHNGMGHVDGVIINPGAYTHYSYAIFDAIKAIGLPTIEVHLSDVKAREEFRRHSVIAPACITQISGRGRQGYLDAIEQMIKIINNK
jgi:3-dehydroquinate dehydratase-2